MAAVAPPLRSRVVGTLSCQQDSYLRSLKVQVVSCTPYKPPQSEKSDSKSKTKKATDKDKAASNRPTWLVEFDDSILFPEGGGQPTDHGTLTPLSDQEHGPIKVDFIQRQGLHCIVHSPQPLSVGVTVQQDVDFERRWDLMQQHTGQHLLTAVMNTYDNLRTLGWGMGPEGEMSYVDLPRKPTDEELQEIQKKVNDVISQNLPITVETPSTANVDKLPDDYDQEAGVIRVIKIGDLDENTCCGTHLQQTGHIGLLLVGSNTPNSGGRIRQFFITGNRAIHLATTSLSTVRSTSRLLSCTSQSDDVLNSVSKLQDQTATLKKREAKLISEIAQYEAERVKAVLNNERNAFVYRPDEPGMDFINIVAASVRDDIKGSNVVLLASGEGDKGGAILVIGRKDAVESTVAKVKEAFPTIRGGGKGERWQGKMMEWKNGDVEKFREMVVS